MSERKKLLILIMSCNLENYKHKEQIIRDTWFKDIGKYPDIVGAYFFTSSAIDNRKIDEENKIIYVPVQDFRDRTFNKFMESLLLLDSENIEYDYILRLNISTYPNLKLICEYIQTLKQDENLYCGSLCNSPWYNPLELPFAQGEFFIFTKPILKILKDYYFYNKINFDNINNLGSYTNNYLNDDGWVTHIMHRYFTYNKSNMDDYFNALHSLGIIHEYDTIYKYKDLYNTVLCINYKTCPSLNPSPLMMDSKDRYDKVTEKKIHDIHNAITELNKTDYIDKSIKIINENKDTQCYTTSMINSNYRMFDNYMVSKEECIENFKIANTRESIYKYPNYDNYIRTNKIYEELKKANQIQEIK